MDHDLEMQRYLFDLAGYMVIPDVLGKTEIDELKIGRASCRERV